MKRFTLLLTLSMAASLCLAERIPESEAYATALRFVQGKTLSSQPRLKKGDTPGRQADNFYVYNVGDNEGFVIVSGDDRTLPILGYADSGRLDLADIPCNMQWLLDYYDYSISTLDGSRLPKYEPASAPEARETIPSLILTQWGQGEPYNLNCPTHEGSRCLTGCVATAMAQVINYHRWPQAAVSGVNGYLTQTNKIQMPDLPEKTFDWNNMSATAIAQLMLYAGQSVQMDYGPVASGASSGSMPSALADVFGFSRSATLLSRSDYSDEQWNDMVYSELAKGYPVLYSGDSPADGGHAFIVDGYDNGFYHINWGWTGTADGFFSLDLLNPFSGDGFVYGQEMVVNACPPAGTGDVDRPKVIVREFSCDVRALDRSDASSPFSPFALRSVIESDVATDITLQTGYALYDDSGLVKLLYETTGDFIPGVPVDLEAQITVGADVAPGDYRILAVCRDNDGSQWLADACSESVYVALSVGDTSMTIQPMPLSEEEKDLVEYGTHTFDGITYHLYSKSGNPIANLLPLNDTDDYVGDLYIPDYVVYQNMRFDVYQVENVWPAKAPFENNDQITSISTSMNGIYIGGCDNLRKVELRRGCVTSPEIHDCPALEEIVLPWGCNTVYPIENCVNLKSLRLHTDVPMTVWTNWNDDYGLWSRESMPSLADIYFTGDIPPAFSDPLKKPVPNEEVVIHVPAQTTETYRRGGWDGWNLVEDQQLQTINVKLDYTGNDFSNCCDTEGNWGGVVGRGNNNAEMAIRIPKEHLSAYKGCKVTAIEYYTTAPWDNDNGWADVEYVFVTSPGNDYLAKEAVNTVRGCWMRVDFRNPPEIGNEDLFVGIGRHSVIQTAWANDKIVARDGIWTRAMGSENTVVTPGVWENQFGLSSGPFEWLYSIPVRAVIEGQRLPNDIAVLSSEITRGGQSEESHIAGKPFEAPQKSSDIEEGGYFTLLTDGKDAFYQDSVNAGAKRSESADEGDGKAQLRVLMQNRSPRLVNNVTLDWSIDGVAQTPIQFETSLLTNHADEVVVDLPEDIVGRTHTVVANVVDIDGEPDEIEANSNVETEMTLPVSMHFPRKIVMEEATGTWCGWCPEGIVTIEKMKERYPDNFIAIAVHNDEMGVADGSYATFEDMIGSYPSARVNRMRWQSLTPFDLETEKDVAEAMIEATASFTEEGRINVATETTFGFSENGNHAYNIAYVLVEDKVGPYTQANFYSDPSAPEDPENYLDWWIHQGKQVEMLYDDVARAIYNYDGIEGLLPTVFTEGESIASEYTIDLPPYTQNPANLRVVTLLIDTLNGEIMNAASTQIVGPLPPSVERVEVNPASVDGHCGETLQLTATVYPDNAFNKTVTWSSDNTEVATVDETGLVWMSSLGTATVTATAGGISDYCQIEVVPVLVEEIVLTPDAVEALEGSEVVLTAEVRPADADNPVLEWSSDNEAVATVSQDGVVYVNAPGEAVITAAATDGSLVKAQALITGISGVDELFDGDTVWSLYDIDGRILRRELSRGDMELLQPGIYILRSGSRIVKIHINH